MNCAEYCSKVEKYNLNEEQNAEFWLLNEGHNKSGSSKWVDTKHNLLQISRKYLITDVAEECLNMSTGVA